MHLALHFEIQATQSSNLLFSFIVPQSFATVVASIDAVLQTIAKDVVLDQLQTPNLRFFINVKHKFFTFEDTNCEIIGTNDKLVLTILVPINKS